MTTDLITSGLGAAALVLYLWLRQRPTHGAIDWRGVLARLPLPMLALAASYGVYSFATLFVPPQVAAIQAAAFELTYIGLAVTRGLSADQRKRATAISIGAVVASIVYNTLAGWFHRQPGLLDGANPIAWLAFAVLHGAPLAWVAYLVADLLLHSSSVRPRAAHRATLARAIWRLRGLARQARDACAAQASSDAMLAQARADLEAARAELTETLRGAAQQGQEDARLLSELARLEGELARARSEAAQQEQARAQFERAAEQLRTENAQLKREAAQPIVIDGIDLLTIAHRLRERGVSSRETADIVGMRESTLRSRLAATNGHLVEV